MTIDHRTRSESAQSFMRTCATVLLAVVVSAGSAGLGLIVSAIGFLMTVRRGRRIAAGHRRRREVRENREAVQARWDARWESWGGRLPQDGRR